MKSIRQRLLFSLLIGLLVSTTLMTVIAYRGAVGELHELFTDNLRRMAVVLKSQAFPSLPKEKPAEVDTGELDESYVIQIWDKDRNLLRSSGPDIGLPLQRQEGLGQVSAGGEIWEIYTLKAGQIGYVQIAQPQEIVATIIGESAMVALLPLLFLFLLMAVGGWIAVGRSLRPLNDLSQIISGWEVDKMQPLKTNDVPAEIQPVVNSLNSMVQKVDNAMSIQQQFTADSAHELRTPLTAVRLQLDNLMRASGDGERAEAVEKLSAGLDRCTHLVTQLLIASRSTVPKPDPEMQDVRLNELVRSALGSFVMSASQKNIEVSFDCDSEVIIRGDEEGLRVLVNNLIDNAVRYTQHNGQVMVCLSKESTRVVLEVSDTGPGIPASEQKKIFQRFYRVPGSPSTGSGLGLSIVRSVAEIHNAEVSVYSTMVSPGTVFRVVFKRKA